MRACQETIDVHLRVRSVVEPEKPSELTVPLSGLLRCPASWSTTTDGLPGRLAVSRRARTRDTLLNGRSKGRQTKPMAMEPNTLTRLICAGRKLPEDFCERDVRELLLFFDASSIIGAGHYLGCHNRACGIRYGLAIIQEDHLNSFPNSIKMASAVV
jgi:hypothetical protein